MRLHSKGYIQARKIEVVLPPEVYRRAISVGRTRQEGIEREVCDYLGLSIEGVEAITAAKTAKGEVVSDVITNLIATIGENMRLRRSARLSVSEGAVALYLHNAQGEGVGRLGVLVALEGAGDQVLDRVRNARAREAREQKQQPHDADDVREPIDEAVAVHDLHVLALRVEQHERR